MNIGVWISQHPWITLLIIINIVAFALMGIDKACAKMKVFRIPERVLMTVAGLFGALGALLGMFAFHHKIRKPKFAWGVPIFLVIQCAIVYFIATTNWSQWLS